jgi:hypothetical protein
MSSLAASRVVPRLLYGRQLRLPTLLVGNILHITRTGGNASRLVIPSETFGAAMKTPPYANPLEHHLIARIFA